MELPNFNKKKGKEKGCKRELKVHLTSLEYSIFIGKV
jgi:hypothetical protein